MNWSAQFCDRWHLRRQLPALTKSQTGTRWVNFKLLQKASREWGWISPEPAVPRNQMGGSIPICYNLVNSKLLLTLLEDLDRADAG